MNIPIDEWPLWADELRSFLGPFCDASTELAISPVGTSGLLASGSRHFKPLQMEVRLADDGSFVVVAGDSPGPLRNLLASPRYGNLDALAKSIQASLRARVEPTRIVEARIRADEMAPEPAGGLIRRLLTEAIPGRTRLSYLHGPAGAGKSWTLLKIALDQAHAFLTRRSTSVFLYVDAQGVNLRTLEQQIAHQLDLYNGVMRFPEVIPLVRLGVLSIIVDGFDELISQFGAIDTERALYRYLAEFRGQGNLLASARSSFMHLARRSDAAAPDTPVAREVFRIEPWTHTEWQQFCATRGRGDLVASLATFAEHSDLNAQLLTRPFFVDRTVRILEGSSQEIDEHHLLAGIEQEFAQRERVEKLIDTNSPTSQYPAGAPVLTESQFEELLLAVAEEMWTLHQNSLDLMTLKTLAEILGDQWQMSRPHRAALIGRIETHAFLEPMLEGATERRLGFPHEVLFARMLARVLGRRLNVDPREAVRLLRIAPMSHAVAEQFGDLAVVGLPLFRELDQSRPSLLCDQLIDVGKSLRRTADDDSNARINVGTLICDLLRRLPQERSDVDIWHCDFVDVDFAGCRLGDAAFRESVFESIDARGMDWHGIQFVDCNAIGSMRIEEGQTFHSSLPDVYQLIVHSGTEVRTEWGAKATRVTLFGVELGAPVQQAPVLSPRAAEVADLVSKLCRVAYRVFWFSEGVEDRDTPLMRRLKQSRYWSVAIEVLERHGLVQRATRSRSGTESELLRLIDPIAILETKNWADRRPGAPEAKFWDDVEALDA
jgi:hypothetical protein